MKVYRAYKTELKLNNKQKTLCLKSAGAARFAYNWGLAQKKAAFDAKTKIPTAIDLHKKLNAIKETEFPWMYEVSKYAPQEALRNLDVAFSRFFEKISEFPQFKNKKNGIGGFRLHDYIKVTNNTIKLPRLGKLKLKEKGYLPVNVKIFSATVSEHAGHWFVSIQVEEELKNPPTKDEHSTIGVDLGIKTLVVCSDGKSHENPKALRKNLKKLKRLQRKLSRSKKGSKNREKAKKKLARLHYRIVNIRKNALNQSTSDITKNKSVVCIEDLNVKGMLKNHKLAQAISDVGFGEWRRQLEYKAQWYNCRIIVAPRFYPSSKMCSCCGCINKELKLSEREWTCSECNVHHERDPNAADNLENFAISLMEKENACEVRKLWLSPWIDSSVLGLGETGSCATRMKPEV